MKKEVSTPVMAVIVVIFVVVVAAVGWFLINPRVPVSKDGGTTILTGGAMKPPGAPPGGSNDGPAQPITPKN